MLVAGLLAVASGVARAEKEAAPAEETWYAASIAKSDEGFLVTHFWSKGARLRSETVAGGRRLITIVDATTYYVIDPTRGEAIGIARSPLSIRGDAKRTRPFGDELGAVLRAGGEQVVEHEVGGRKLVRYQLTNDAGRVQVWVTPTLELPVRVERWIRSSSHREQLDYINWLRGIDVAEGFFRPPSDVPIERVGYEDYVRRAMTERLGPAPPFFAHLLHGEPEE